VTAETVQRGECPSVQRKPKPWLHRGTFAARKSPRQSGTSGRPILYLPSEGEIESPADRMPEGDAIGWAYVGKPISWLAAVRDAESVIGHGRLLIGLIKP